MNDIDAFGDDWVLSGKARSTFESYRLILAKAPFELPGTLREAKRWLSERRSEVSSSTIVDELLTEAGLENYEVSNWATPGHECWHNLLYWRQED